MKIEKIDQNFMHKNVEVKDKKACYTIPHERFSLHGVFYDFENTRFTRVPCSVAQATSENVAYLATNTAGGRLCFSTNSEFIQITVAFATSLTNMRHMPITGSSGFSLFEVTEKGEEFVKLLCGEPNQPTGFTVSCSLKTGKLRHYVLYFPLYNDVATLAVTLDEKAVVEKYAPYKDVLPIVYYGSSITQGGCASRPDQSYQALICKKNRVDFVNLGFSGSARGEDAMADYIASLPCSLFVYDYDFNAPTVAHLQATHSRLYQRFRKSHPDTPVLMISRPDYRGLEEQEARVKVIEQTYQDAKARKENVYFLHGKTFFAGGNVWDFTVDGTHPTDLGFAAMAQKIYQVIEKISKDFQGE